MEDPNPGLPTRTVVFAALFIPVIIAIAFLIIFHWVNRPTPGPMKPGEGLQIAERNDNLLLAHAIAQLTFVIFGTAFIARRRKARVLFLVIAIPFCGLVYLTSMISLWAP